MEYSHAAAMPTAVMLPRCQNGGESEKFSAMKPMMVVNDVIVTGRKLRRIASTIASLFSLPSRIAVRSEVRMWIESAIARVRMMIGAEAEIGVSAMPANPAQPMPTMVESMMTPTVANVAENERRIRTVKSRITPNISGTSVPRSWTPTSAKALFSIETPVREMSISGYSSES